MRRLKKRILAILLAAAMTVCETPVTFATTAAGGVSEAQSAYLQAKEEALQSAEASEAGEVTDEEAGEETLPAESASEELGGVNSSEESGEQETGEAVTEESGEQAGETEQSAESSLEASAQEEAAAEAVSESEAQESGDAAIEESGEQAGETEQSAESSLEEAAQEEEATEAVSESGAQESGEAVTEEIVAQEQEAVSQEPEEADAPQESASEAAETVILETEEETAVFYLAPTVSDDTAITSKTVLDNDVIYTGDLVISADVELNGHKLEVCGNLRHLGYTYLKIQGGELIVGGDYIIRQANGEASGGRLVMENAADRVTVGGDFIAHQNVENKVTEGILTIGGNFYQESTGNSTFSASGNHKTVFSGNGDLTINIKHIHAGLNKVEIENLSSRKVTWTGYMSAAELTQNLDLYTEGTLKIRKLGMDENTIRILGADLVYLANVELGGGSLEIDGAAEINGEGSSGDVELGGGTMQIKNDLRHSGYGVLRIQGGTLTVGGNYIIESADKTASGGKLVMENAADRVTVGGDFIAHQNINNSEVKEGILTIGGNFSQDSTGTSGFYASGNHKTVFSGDGNLAISIGNGKASRLNQVEIENASSRKITWTGYLSVAELTQDMVLNTEDGLEITELGMTGGNTVTIRGADMVYCTKLNLGGGSLTIEGNVNEYSDFDLEGGTLHVTGNLRQVTYGTLRVGSGSLIVDGNYLLANESDGPSGGYLYMENADGRMTVGGDFIVNQSGYNSNLTAGEITIYGNFSQVGTSGYFKASKDHKIILAGTEDVTIEMKDSSSCFNELVIENAASRKVAWKDYVTVKKLAQDLELNAAGDFKIRELGMDGNHITVTGMDTITASEVNVGGGTLTIDGAAVIDGTVKLSGGVLEIRGDAAVNSVVKLGGGSMTVTGDAVQNADVYLEGGTLTVTGNLRHTAGRITFEKGTLDVGGWYKAQKEDAGVTSASTGNLWMTNAEDTFHVGGDFVVQGSTNSSLSYGTITVGGDFRQQGNGYIFQGSTGNKVVLDGSKDLTIEVQDGAHFRFGQLEITDGTRDTVTWIGNMNVSKLLSDLHVTPVDAEGESTLTITKLDQNGKDLVVAGDVILDVTNGGLSLNGGNLKVNGNLRHTAGTIYFQKGTVDVSGWYKAQKEDAGGVTSASTGNLWMTNAEDTFHVGGDFVVQGSTHSSLSYGTITVGGDFRQQGAGYIFQGSTGNKVVLDASKALTIEVQDGANFRFGQLEIKDGASGNITWKGNMYVYKLLSDLHVTPVDADGGHTMTVDLLDTNGHDVTIQGDVILNTNITLNGKTLDISGNLRQNNGRMDVSGGTLKVGGWYKIQRDNSGTPAASTGTLLMTKENDLVEVGGDFVIHTGGTNKFTAGELRVGGNFSQAGTGSSCFAAGGTHKTVMTGQSGPYTIAMEASRSKFAYLKLTLPYDQYIFQPDEDRWDVLMVTSITLNKENLTFYSAEGTEQLTAVIDPEKATNKNMTWSSSNTAVVTVDQTGLVTAAGKGTAVITVSAKEDETVKASCVVTVTDEDALIREQLIRNPRTETVEIDGTETEVTTWDCVSFGSYLQEDTNEDEEINADDEKKPIVWRVLEKDESRGELLLIADQCLDLKAYHEETGTALSWDDAALKAWLNSEFLQAAFTEEERAEIAAEGVSLLTQEDITKAEYGFTAANDKTRAAQLTIYAGEKVEEGKDTPGWWLQTPGNAADKAFFVSEDGAPGEEASDSLLGVRPVIRIPISSLRYTYAGWINSEDEGGKNHVLTKHERKEATCGEAGTKEYWSCVICGECFEDENAEDEISDLETWKVLPATGQHSLTQQKGTAPGCTAPGKKTYHSCDVCGKNFEDADAKAEITQEIESWSVIPASGHAMTLHEAALADCTKTGKKAYYSCNTCGKNFEDADGKKQITEAIGKWEIVPAKGHSMKAHAGSAATCTAAGAKTYYTCSACGKNFEDAGGKSEITGDVQKWAVIPAGGHSLKAHAGSAATCAKAGAKVYYTCGTCGKHFEDANGKTEVPGDVQKWAAIPMTGHSLTKHEGTEASCAEGGTKTYYSCGVCGKHFEDADAKSEITGDVSAWAAILPGAHTLEFTEGTPASCTEEGTKPYYSCAVCGKYFEDADAKTEITQEISDWEVLPMTEHVEVANESVTPATTTKDGLAGGTVCAVCGEELREQETVYKASNIKLSAASYGYDGKVKKPALTVKDCEGNVIPKEYYTVKTPSGRKNVGTYTYKITFKGWYKGTASVSFDIVPAAVKLKSVTAGSKSVKVQWAKSTKEITGYEIQYSTSKKFTASTTKTVTVSTKNATSKTITKLSAKKKYYVRIRAYKTVSKKKYYSKWSASKSTTTKKAIEE